MIAGVRTPGPHAFWASGLPSPCWDPDMRTGGPHSGKRPTAVAVSPQRPGVVWVADTFGDAIHAIDISDSAKQAAGQGSGAVISLGTRPDLTLADAVNEALQKRPDVLQAKTTIEADDVNVRTSHNALLPSLSLSAFASSVGLGGNSKNRTTSNIAGSQIVGANGTPILVTGPNGVPIPVFLPSTQSVVTGVTAGGFGDANSQLFRFQFHREGANHEFHETLSSNS